MNSFKTLMPFENKRDALLPFPGFLQRWIKYTLFAFFLIGVSVAIGVVGYHWLAGLCWVDSFYMASMILTGMGPTVTMTTNGAKIFSSFYALYSGVAFLSICAVFFAPVIHRFLHRMHVGDEEEI